MMNKLACATMFLTAVSLGCATTPPEPKYIATATAVMEPRSGSEVKGTVTFHEREDGMVRVNVDLTGVPDGVHGFHVHDKGDCSAPDASSAGGHFNPLGAQHAGPGDPQHHAGDLGNVFGKGGVVKEEYWTKSITLGEGVTNIVGHAVIVHANRDDLTSQPAGNAGGRIACGVVTLASGK